MAKTRAESEAKVTCKGIVNEMEERVNHLKHQTGTEDSRAFRQIRR
jgi:hypothetical protein